MEQAQEQVAFYEAVMRDKTLSKDNKIHWLYECAKMYEERMDVLLAVCKDVQTWMAGNPDDQHALYDRLCNAIDTAEGR
jgi:hypothetical protein